ncbi:uncharacterized protein LOC123348587 [Mauremys mutica]|uniref:uncharacterized protein LOC123348587 n=1 Tax=Mauremys mutica TaxID=74926 RepID=UPI001D16EFB3|nr:uncharacterized protein LOC123348587 [Mauremys mutica]
MSSQESAAMIATPPRENPLVAWLKAYALQEVLIGNLSDVPSSHDCVACTRREASDGGSPFLWKFLPLTNLTPQHPASACNNTDWVHRPLFTCNTSSDDRKPNSFAPVAFNPLSYSLTLQQIRGLSLGLEALTNITAEGFRQTSDALTVLASYAEQNRLLIQTILQKDFCVALEDPDPRFKGQCCLHLQPGWNNISAVADQLSSFAVQIRKERKQWDPGPSPLSSGLLLLLLFL